MNASYKIVLTEGEKSVKVEVSVEKENKEEAKQEAMELYEELSKYSKTKTLQKHI